MTAVLWLLGGSFLGAKSSTFRQGVLIEAQAEVAHDATLSLRRVKAPVLVIVGGNDNFFPAGSAQEMADMMPTSTLKIYPGKGHDILNEKQFAQDVAAFIGAHPTPAAA
jgi:pimeloyl-ACP methyl ester carboxylesterase